MPLKNASIEAYKTLKRLREAAEYRSTDLDRLTLQQLIRATPPEIVDRQFTVRITSKYYEVGSNDGFRRVYNKDRPYYNQARTYTISSRAAGGSGKKHMSLIRFYGPPDPKTPVWVWCDCEMYQFYLEVVLSDRNSSSIKNSNGEPPTVRNPQRVPYLCKHLLRSSRWALSQTRDMAAEKMAPPETEGSKEAGVKRTAAMPLKNPFQKLSSPKRPRSPHLPPQPH